MSFVVDYIIPFHSDYKRVQKTLVELNEAKKIYPIKNIYLCHNGENNDNFNLLKSEINLTSGVTLLHTDGVGIGAGYKLGIQNAVSSHIVLSASDLPFKFTDLKAYIEHDDLSVLGIGSKAHSKSKLVGRSKVRSLATYCFYLARRLALGSATPKDSQGTIIVSTDLAKKLLKYECSDSYLFSLEFITYSNCCEGVSVVELPIELEEEPIGSSVKIIKHSIEMFKGIFALRNKLRGMKRC